MENASKALLMAAGVLIGILILTLIAILSLAGNEVFSGYEESKTSEMVQRFNSNFTKYTGIKLTAHQVVTICNYADEANLQGHPVTIDSSSRKTVENIKSDISSFTGDQFGKLKTYTISVGFGEDGYVNGITISKVAPD